MTKIILRKGRDESLRRQHPWVFSGAVARIDGPEPAEGEVVTVLAADGELLGCGHYQKGSIAVRMLSFTDEALPADFWDVRLAAALKVREALHLDQHQTNCYRLVHGEGDLLPGLVIDWYDGVCVLQAHSAGMFLARGEICQALQRLYGDALVAVYDKSEGTAPHKAGLQLADGYLYKNFRSGDAADTADGVAGHSVCEHGNRFVVDWENGQKTGFFLDQRENRAAVGRMAEGRRVLNLFCYTGGFSVYALAGGALHVDSVDSSAKAIALTDRNVALGGFAARHESHCCDALDFLHSVPTGSYDLMIVDPPAFAKHRDALRNALRAYQRLNEDAIAKVAPGGIVFTFSCSQAVSHDVFAQAVMSAAIQVGRRVRILDRLNQPADHPVSIFHPEGEYLKGLVLYVE